MNYRYCERNIIDDKCTDHVCDICKEVFCSQKCLNSHIKDMEDM